MGQGVAGRSAQTLPLLLSHWEFPLYPKSQKFSSGGCAIIITRTGYLYSFYFDKNIQGANSTPETLLIFFLTAVPMTTLKETDWMHLLVPRATIPHRI